MGIFGDWQPLYARHGIATFPVEITSGGDKKPATKGYLKTGLRGSERLAQKFAEANSFGFACGPRSRITIVDMDNTDPAIVEEGERLFGRSPLLWRTGGGKYAMAFRHSGEGRCIRPLASLPIDVLGDGFAVAPPSVGAITPYQIIRGTLADLDRLPTARIPDEIRATHPRIGIRIPKGKRNVALFNYCCSVVAYCDTLEQLLDAANTWAAPRLDVPLAAWEIRKTCNSVWQYQGGRKRIMNHIIAASQWDALAADPAVLGVFSYLSAVNGPDAEFMIADGLAEARGWPRRLVPAARHVFLELGLIECIRWPGVGKPALYRWCPASPEGGG